jgi:hypothetical protein
VEHDPGGHAHLASQITELGRPILMLTRRLQRVQAGINTVMTYLESGISLPHTAQNRARLTRDA